MRSVNFGAAAQFSPSAAPPRPSHVGAVAISRCWNAILDPSGDQAISRRAVAEAISVRVSPPSVCTCSAGVAPPVRKASRRPSGDQRAIIAPVLCGTSDQFDRSVVSISTVCRVSVALGRVMCR